MELRIIKNIIMQKRNRGFLQGDISFPPVPLQRKMDWTDNPIMDFIGGLLKSMVGYGDMAYKNSWLFYLIVGLIGLLVYVLFFN